MEMDSGITIPVEMSIWGMEQERFRVREFEADIGRTIAEGRSDTAEEEEGRTVKELVGRWYEIGRKEVGTEA